MKHHAKPSAARPILVGLCALALLMPGCRGCSDGLTPQQRAAQKQKEKEKEEEERKKKEEEEKKKKKPPMELGALRPVPTQSDQPIIHFKPGHWTTVSQEMKRNYDDWVGSVRRTVVDSKDRPVTNRLSRFSIRNQRPVALSKGQSKQIESVLFTPPELNPIRLRSEVISRDTLAATTPMTDMANGMLPHQYYFVVLATNPASYGRLGSLRSANAPVNDHDFDIQHIPGFLPPRLQYRVVAPEVKDRVPLPDSLLCLTSVAYVLWDEINPELFNPAQRAALVDWIHWGGQLIISGPDSLALLRNSFLEPYLPAEGNGAWKITQQDLRPLADEWGVGRQGTEFKIAQPWSGIRLKVVEDQADRCQSDRPVAKATAQLNCGGLFAERRVGRGRVLVSAIQLNQRSLQTWENGYECLMNAVVFRRPPRRFRPVRTEVVDENWTPDIKESTEWAEGDRYAIDAGVNSQLRLLTRDTYQNADAWRFRQLGSNEAAEPNQFGGMFGNQAHPVNTIRPPDYPGGVGGWDDFNQASTAARSALREAAGVTVPGAGFVVGSVAIYLLVLAPFNWMLFRALGRVELAWVAAPVIAIAGTVVVVKQAQLDIGFVRAQTEVAILEMQPNHPRGCLTRYTGFYTSLSTNYDVTFDDPGAVVAPFGREGFELKSGQDTREVVYDRQEKARLLGLNVYSASTEMIHSEEMHDAGKAIRLGRSTSGILQVENLSEWDLRHLVVVYRPRDEVAGEKAATLRGCWIGDLAYHGSAALNWSPPTATEGAAPYADQREEDAGNRGAELLNLEPLWDMALDARHFEPGEYRAVARIDQSLPGMEVSPRAAQETGATLLVAHLQYEIPRPPRADKNAPVDVRRE